MNFMVILESLACAAVVLLYVALYWHIDIYVVDGKIS